MDGPGITLAGRNALSNGFRRGKEHKLRIFDVVNGKMHSHLHNQGSKDSFGGHSNASEPKLLPRSARSANRPGRKIVMNAPSAHLLEKKESARAKAKNTENASIEELDQMLEDDALVLLNMKKDITQSQKEELLRLKNSALSVKKEYDALFVFNNLKETQLKALEDKRIVLQRVENATHMTSSGVDELKKELEEQALAVIEEYDAEQRTIKMQNLMIKRLEREITECRIDTAKATVLVDHAKHDVGVTENTLQAARQEVIELEMQLEKLQATLKTRKDQREQKLGVLVALSQEGENSVARLQTSMSENSRVRARVDLFPARFCMYVKPWYHFVV
jgi:chromosome segregation ATPase